MSRPRSEIYDCLSDLLAYPADAINERSARCVRLLTESDSPALPCLKKFSDYVESSGVDRLQELYTRTFEINPVTALEVGWHLYGERYERGEFLVKMRQMLRDLDLKESSELPDHLTQALKALGRLEKDDAELFAGRYVLPAIDKMISGFKGKESAYADVIEGIRCELTNQFGSPT